MLWEYSEMVFEDLGEQAVKGEAVLLLVIKRSNGVAERKKR